MRSLSTAFLTAIKANVVTPILMVSIAFENETIYLWSGYGNLSWNGNTWTGTGTLGTVSNMAEVSDLSAQNIVLSLDGIPNELLSDVINTANQNNPVLIYLGFLSAGAIVSTPVLIFSGFTDVPTITCGPQTSSITISCENPLICLNLASNRVYSSSDQWIDYPNDQGFTFVPSIQDWNGNWGTAGGSNPASSGTSVSGTGSGTSGGVGNGPSPVKNPTGPVGRIPQP